ncbi:hypothetical protein S7711_06062 [Stachybotrys chartarum IBT 7711]|uniref:Uncharacterized protein n=1 Tax=Stachybotrys chartarum (strain CBS 109288 / IBT 7711) TaxID=1280523 RepID=A0A084B222_STACB|nr:hypothetical protein S7711_06062 [Stachybotrys chartarum IBT 7711]
MSASQLVYNIFFHPLASYPGPLYLIASEIALTVYSLLGTSQYPLKAAHDKYGEIVRIAPGTLSCIKPQAWDEIYGFKKDGGGIAKFPKDPAFYDEKMLVTQQRTFRRSLLEQEAMTQEHVGRLMEHFENDFGFGEDMGCVKTGVYHDWVKFVIDYFFAATLPHQRHKLWPLNRLLALCITASTRRMQAQHNEASWERVRRRMAADKERHDFMYCFLRQAHKEKLVTKTIEAQASVVILAGSETSSVAETAAIYEVLTRPDVYKRLNQEIRSTFGSIEIKLQDVLSRLPYLDAVVKETLRIHAPLANGFTR